MATSTSGLPDLPSFVEDSVDMDTEMGISTSNQDADVDLPIDCVNPVQEQSILDETVPSTLPDDKSFCWEVVNEGTKRGKPRLQNTDGYSFTIYRLADNVTYWRCTKQQRGNRCPATCTQRGTSFKPGINRHNHPGDPGLNKVAVAVKERCSADVFVLEAAKEALQNLASSHSDCLSKPTNISRLQSSSAMPSKMDVAMGEPAGASAEGTAVKNEPLPMETNPLEPKSSKVKIKCTSITKLEDLIDAQLAGMDFLKVAKQDDALNSLNSQIRHQERKAKEISKIFAECEEQLKRFKEELEAEQGIESGEEPPKIESGDDSDEDVMIVDTSTVSGRAAAMVSPNAPRSAQSYQQTGNVLNQPSPAKDTPKNSKQGISPKKLVAPSPPDPPHASAFRPIAPKAQIQYQTVVQGQALSKALALPLTPAHVTMVTTPSASAGSNNVVTLSNQPGSKSQLGPQVAGASKSITGLAPGMKLYGKKFNDIWYKGTLVDIIHKEKARIERRYSLKFDGKGKKILDGRHIAYADHPSGVLPVGSRVVAMYKDEEASPATSFYAGIVAESPSVRNNHRYLVFFDDGYAQYCTSKDLHKVVEQSKNVWEDIHPDSQEFIKSYLKQYPERPMVRLQKGQIVKTEWNGEWWTARVQEVDASLVKMFFDADRRVEWIYRGSTRLEPLYTELANAEASKASGKGRRHNVSVKSSKKPYVEYTRGTEEDHSKPLLTAQSHPHLQTQTQPQLQSQPRPQPQPQPHSMPQVQSPTSPTSAFGLRTLPPYTQMMTNLSVVRANNPTTPVPRMPQQVQAPPVQHQPMPRTVSSDSLGSNNGKKRAVAKKSTTMKSAPVIHRIQDPIKQFQKGEKRTEFQTSSISRNTIGRDMASVLQERLADFDMDEEALGERVDIENKVLTAKDTIRKKYKPHRCSNKCLEEGEDDPGKYKGNNPLLIPMLCGWERQIGKQKNTGKRVIFYRAPCARRMRSIEEVDRFLVMTDCQLTIDLFCYEPCLHTHSEFVPIKTFCDIKDLSYGKENVPISCVNGIDRNYPDYVEYSNQRIPAKGVTLNVEPEFMVGCDCTDGCKDPNKCACIQRTFEATKSLNGGKIDDIARYHYRRLRDPVMSGMYECNSNCRCDHRCHNRVAQNPLSLRLQCFKTEKRGWGLRCLDDIPAGGFICVYAGQLLTEQGANEDGQQYGDEYLAELDYIEVVERMKEGYESDVPDIDEANEEDDDNDTESEEFQASDSDSNFSDKYLNNRGSRSPRSKKKDSDDKVSKLVLKREQGNKEKPWSVKMKDVTAQKTDYHKKTEEWVRSIPDDPIVISDEEDSGARQLGSDLTFTEQLDGTSDPVKSDSDKSSEVQSDQLGAAGKSADKPSDQSEVTSTQAAGQSSQEKSEDSVPSNDELPDLAEDVEMTPTVPEEHGSPGGDSDMDSLGEKKLDTPPQLTSSTKVSLKLKDSEDTKLSKDLTRKPLRVPRIKERALNSSSPDEDSRDSIKVASEASATKCKEEKGDGAKMEVDNHDEDTMDNAVSILRITEPTSLNIENIDSDDSDDRPPMEEMEEKEPDESEILEDSKDANFRRTTRSQTSRFYKLPDPKNKQHISPLKIKLSTLEVQMQEEKTEKKNEIFCTRRLFGEEFCYVMDAKSMGNIGRYLNHSCAPNVFVQNVFVDTHDLRFPWVAFFAAQYIRAGTELTWDYNYEVGSVPGKVLYCYCGAAECRGRLL